MSTDLPHGDVVDADEADVLLLLLLTCWAHFQPLQQVVAVCTLLAVPDLGHSQADAPHPS